MDVPPPVSSQSPRFLDQLRTFIRARGLAYRTETTYCAWIRRFIRFNRYQSHRQLDAHHIQGFLNYLAVDQHCSVNTQKTALNALVFLFREFLKQDIPDLHFRKAAVSRKLPTVLSSSEVARVLLHLDGTHRLMVQMMYGSQVRRRLSLSGCRAIRSGILSRLSYFGRVRIFVLFRRSWATPQLKQRRSIRTLSVCMNGAW